MKVYLISFYIDNVRSGDVLVFRNKRNAINRFKVIRQRIEDTCKESTYFNNDDSHAGYELLMSIHYDTEKSRDRYELTQQSTED